MVRRSARVGKLQPFSDDPVQRAAAILGQPLEQTRIPAILVRREIQIPWHAAKLFLVFRPLIALTTLIAPAETSAIEAEHHQILTPVELRDRLQVPAAKGQRGYSSNCNC